MHADHGLSPSQLISRSPKASESAPLRLAASGVSLHFCFQGRLAELCGDFWSSLLRSSGRDCLDVFSSDQIELMLQDKKAEKHDRVRWVRTCFARDHGTDFLLLQSVAGKDFSESRRGELFTFPSVKDQS